MDKEFAIEFSQFNQGQAPLAHLDTKTFVGNRGQSSEIKADIISKPGFLTQSPALADLTNGNQSGVVDQLIRFILDRPTSTDVTYAVGTTKLYKLSSTTVASGGTPSWPQTISDMTEGESIIRVNDNLLIFYNKSSGGDIAALDLGDESIDDDFGSDTDAALEKAPHPTAVNGSTAVFGNGRYLGVFIDDVSPILDVQKLDFGKGAEVSDVVFHANSWWIAVNYADGKGSRIFMYAGGATTNILDDEAGIGDQKIGFLHVHNGNIFVVYQDKTSGVFAVGWLSGRSIKPLRYFSGSLPNHRQKALYKNTILFASSGDIWSCGASVEQLPIQISKLADGGHTTIGAIASPFGTPIVASSDGSSSHRLAKFSGYSTDSIYKSIFVDVTKRRWLGRVHTMIVSSKALGVNARCDITIEADQGDKTSTAMEYSGEGKVRGVFRSINLNAVEDVRIVIDYENGNAVNDCPIRKILLLGNFVEF